MLATPIATGATEVVIVLAIMVVLRSSESSKRSASAA
jgi:hypothetical protein